MAKTTTNTVLDHTSDAGFRAWAQEHLNLLLTGGAFAQTADTGQPNLSTATRPGVNSELAPIFLAYTDSLQSTAPYVVAIYYGTSGVATVPRIRIAIGTGTNGAGVLTGVLLAPTTIGPAGAATSTTTEYLSRACGLPGTISVAWKIGAVSSTGAGFLGLHRVRNEAGEQTGDGIVLLTGSPTGTNMIATMFCARRVSPATFGGIGTAFNQFCLVTLLAATTASPSGPPRSIRHFAALPDSRPLVESLTVVLSECPAGTEFDARPAGVTDRHYISIGDVLRGCAAGAAASTATYGVAMIWEDD